MFLISEQDEQQLLMSVALFAKINRAYYEGLLEQGFAADQAMDLTMAHGYDWGAVEGGGQ